MNFLESMQERYTTKKYNRLKKINPTEIEELKEVLRLCPSSINSQPWKFTFVSDTKTKSALATASFFNANKIIDCDTVIVFSRINHIPFFEKQITESLSEAAVGYYNDFLKPLPEEQLKGWFDSQVYLSIGVLLSACAQMNIDATPMEGIEPEKYNTILNDNNYHALVAVAIGYRASDDANQPSKNPKSRRPLNEVVKSI